METVPKFLESFAFPNELTLANRVVMAPMTTWAANDDATVSEEEIAYYRTRANGVGMVLTGCTHVTANGIGFTGEFASYDDAFIPSLTRLAEAAKSGGAPAVLQIFHAGNKAVPDLIPGGEIVSASAVKAPRGPFNSGDVTPRALAADEITDIVSAFGQATRRAIEAGFDGIELHGAHGFLIQNFFSPLYNQRSDEWGGSLKNRMRFPSEVVREVRRVIAATATRPFVLGYRISPEESEPAGLRINDTYALVDRLVDLGVDYIHASLSSVLDATPVESVDGRTVAELVVGRVAGRVPVIAAGSVRTPEQAQQAIDLGLSLVAIGQGLVVNPDWLELAKTRPELIAPELKTSRIANIALPAKLWDVIEATKGWFSVSDDGQRKASRRRYPSRRSCEVVIPHAPSCRHPCRTKFWRPFSKTPAERLLTATRSHGTFIVSGQKLAGLSRAMIEKSGLGAFTPDFSFSAEDFQGQYRERSQNQGKAYYEALGIARDDSEGRRRASVRNYTFFGAPRVALLFMPSVGDNVRVAGDIGTYAQTFLLSLTARGIGGVPQTILGFVRKLFAVYSASRRI